METTTTILQDILEGGAAQYLAGPPPTDHLVGATGAPTAADKENRRASSGSAASGPGSEPAAGEEKAPFHDAGNINDPGAEGDDGGTPEDPGAGRLERSSSGGSSGGGAPTAVRLATRALTLPKILSVLALSRVEFSASRSRVLGSCGPWPRATFLSR